MFSDQDDSIERSLTRDYKDAEAKVDAIRQRVADHHLAKIQRLIEQGEMRVAREHLSSIPDILTQCHAVDALKKAGWKDSHRFLFD